MQKLSFEECNFNIFHSVYFPHEDSFLLSKYSKLLKGKILDVGCGSGIQSIINAKHNPSNSVVGVDINPIAVNNSTNNAKLNNLSNVSFKISNLFSTIDGKFDHIIFNPPYLPTSKEEKLKNPENFAYDGGEDGRKILDIFLNQFFNYLSDNGHLLLLQSSLNNLEKTKEILSKKSFSVDILEKQKFFFEELYVLKSVKL